MPNIEHCGALLAQAPKNTTIIEQQTLELWELVCQVGFTDLSAAKQFLYADWQEMQHPWQKALLLTGRAKSYSLEGNLLATTVLLEEALDQINDPSLPLQEKAYRESKAYIHYEKAVFLIKTNEIDRGKKQLIIASKLTSSRKLRLACQYLQIVTQVRKSAKNTIPKIQKIANRLEKEQIFFLSHFAGREIGLAYEAEKDFSKAEQQFRLVKKAADGHGLHYLSQLTSKSLGYNLYLQERYHESLEVLEETLQRVDSHYLRSLLLECIALSNFGLDNENAGLQALEEALSCSLNNYVVTKIAEEALYLGNRYLTKHQDIKKAAYYYQLGYQESLKHADYGLPLRGDRLEVVKTYVQFLRNHLPATFEDTPKHLFFDFSLGKSWQQIKDLFHYNLVMYHRIHTGKTGPILKHLGIPPTTYYSLQNRLKSRGILFPKSKAREDQLPDDQFIESLQRYIDLHAAKDWETINDQFEQDLFGFLYQYYGYNKQRLGSMLDLSYSVIISKTRRLTQPHGDLPARHP